MVIPFLEPLYEHHRETEALLVELNQYVSQKQGWKEVCRVYHALTTSLTRHYLCEEHGLFPVLSQYKTMILMEVEHENLLKAQQQLGELAALCEQDGQISDAFLTEFQVFEKALHAHIREEEHGVFPLVDKFFEPEEKDLVARRLQEVHAMLSTQEGFERLSQKVEPTYHVGHYPDITLCSKPIAYDMLFEKEHVQVQQIQLTAQKGLNRHWAGQQQFLMVLSGCVTVIFDHDAVLLQVGQTIHIEPRLPFAVTAQEDAHLLSVKVWPRPHFIRSSP